MFALLGCINQPKAPQKLACLKISVKFFFWFFFTHRHLQRGARARLSARWIPDTCRWCNARLGETDLFLQLDIGYCCPSLRYASKLHTATVHLKEAQKALCGPRVWLGRTPPLPTPLWPSPALFLYPLPSISTQTLVSRVLLCVFTRVYSTEYISHYPRLPLFLSFFYSCLHSH